ncbi:MAG TPA: hypothetical protein VG733_04855 [Chthoniobacteraceae bacterium]|nr:hypothetical protein [Chthoniobacteraceae bacterium]
MKAHSLLFFLLAAACCLLPGCERRQAYGTNYVLSLYNSEDKKAFAAAGTGFDEWLVKRGLTKRPSPGGMSEWSGMHTDGDTETWYQLPIGKNLLLLRITANREHGQIDATVDDNGTYTKAELAALLRSQEQLWSDMIDWFDTGPGSADNHVGGGAAKWFSKARTDIAKEYKKRAESSD